MGRSNRWSRAAPLAAAGAPAALVLVPSALAGGLPVPVLAAALLLVAGPAMLGELTLGKVARAGPLRAFGTRAWGALGVAALLAAGLVLALVLGWASLFLVGLPEAWQGSGEPMPAPAAPVALAVAAAVAGLATASVARGLVQRIVLSVGAIVVLGVGTAAVVSVLRAPVGAFDLAWHWSWRALPAAVAQAALVAALGQAVLLAVGARLRRQHAVGDAGACGGIVLAVLAGLASTAFLPWVTGGAAPVVWGETTLGNGAGPVWAVASMASIGLAAALAFLVLLEVATDALAAMGTRRAKAAVATGLLAFALAVAPIVDAQWRHVAALVALHVLVLPAAAVTALYAGWTSGLGREMDRGLRSRVGVYVVWNLRVVTPAILLATAVAVGFWGDAFWSADAGLRELARAARAAMGVQ